jgi:hypothetical protein
MISGLNVPLFFTRHSIFLFSRLENTAMAKFAEREKELIIRAINVWLSFVEHSE